MKTICRLAALALAAAAPLALAGTAEAAGTGSISGVVWHDLNSNGAREAGEPAISGAALYIDDGISYPTVLTDAKGRYEFRDLAPGTYPVKSGDRSLSHGQGWTRSGADSRFREADGRPTAPVTVRAGRQVKNLNSGFATGKVDTKVWQLFVSNPNPKVGDVIDIVGSTVHDGNVYDQFGGQLTLPEGLRVVERLGGMPKFWETEPAGKVTGYFHDRKPGSLPEWVGARVVVEKPLVNAEIKYDVFFKGVFGSTDTVLTNDATSRTLSTTS